jgi:3-deoxy-D-manno-octulosonic-acid transferase
MFSRRAWRRIAPDLVILTEGERWPEHIHQAGKRGVPVVAVNARMSDRSFRRLRKFGFAARPVLDGITRLLACSEPDAARFRALGVPAERMQTTGNIKLDVRIPRLGAAEKAGLRRELGLPAGGRVLMGASTWPGEEEVLLETLRRARGEGIACSLLVVPRHAERRRQIEPVMRARGLAFHFRSGGAVAETGDVAVGDTTGEMRNFLQLADVVFVGKSLPPHTEGQTPVESAALGCPLVLGPGMANFRAIARELVQAGAAVQVADAAAAETELVALLREDGRRATLAAAAQAWQRANAGAVERTLAAVWQELGRTGSGRPG